MFGLLKNKINSFISSIVKKEEEKPEEKKEGPAEAAQTKPDAQFIPEPEKEIVYEAKPAPPPEPQTFPEEKKEAPAKTRAEQHIHKPEPKAHAPEQPKPTRAQERKVPPQKPTPIHEPKKEHAPAHELKKAPISPGKKEIPVPLPPEEAKPPIPPPRLEDIVPSEKNEERELKVKLSLGSRLRSFISSEVEIKESDVSGLLEGLNLALLESDVAYEVADHITSEMRSKLVGMKVPKDSVDRSVKDAVRSSLLGVLSKSGPDLLEFAKGSPKPVKILLLGPNGAGKTTTLAKLSRLFMDGGFSVVISASDTFRAAAIEQAEKHGEKLGVRVIKHKYGADPTAVAFDAVNYARANKIDVVLIDSAGRQETNRNLLEEMKKIARVVNPDLKLFIGESIAGNALVMQVKSFSDAVGLDGVILTKLDCDAKGGTALSLTKATGVPILYFGVGQAYGDLVPFSAEYVVGQILGS